MYNIGAKTMEVMNNHRSPEINQIMGALAKAQGSYKKLKANEESAGGKKFANLQAILDAVKDSLANNGLGFYQYIELLDEGSGAALLRTVLGHESGQYISSCARVVAGKTDRATGNIYEVHKRFHALMLLGIAPSENDPMAFDDNGDLLADERILEELKKPREQQKLHTEETVTKEQYNDLMIELEGYPELVKDIQDTYDIETLADLPKAEYHIALGKLRRIKKTHDEYVRRQRT
jgi:hypothetical protein